MSLPPLLHSPAVGLLLLAIACVGHTALLVVSLNLWYSQPFNRRFLHAVRFVHGLLVLAGPLVFAAAYGVKLDVLRDNPLSVGGAILTAYLLLCMGFGLVIVPAVTLWRLLRGRPTALVSNHTKTVDVAAELGYRPIGRGKYQLLARLPRNEVFCVDFAERTLQVPALPAAWDGLSILHVTDLHFRGVPDKVFFQHVMDRCRDWEPDLVAITGDIVDSDRHHRWVVPVLGRLRWRVGAFAVLGNHDSWHEPNLTRRRLRKLGIEVLGNAWKQIDVGGVPMVLVGHEGPWFQPGPDLSDCPPEPFRVCLSHTPDNIGWARANGVRLMLAGHNHGGQIRFPLIGSVFCPSRYSRRYDCGTFDEPPTLMHVSRGVGGQQPLRYNCRPEVAKIILTR
jgi:predicted MPP superfamily phosphohydrolase